MNNKVKEVQKMLWDILATDEVKVDDTVVIEEGIPYVPEEKVIELYDMVKVAHEAGIRGGWRLLSLLEGGDISQIFFFEDIFTVAYLGEAIVKNPNIVEKVKNAIKAMQNVHGAREIFDLNRIFNDYLRAELGGALLVWLEETMGLNLEQMLDRIFKVGDPVVNYRTLMFKYILKKVRADVQEQRKMFPGIQGPSRKLIAKVVYEEGECDYDDVMFYWLMSETGMAKEDVAYVKSITRRMPLWKMEWLIRAIKRSDYLTKERVEYGPNGEEYKFRMIAIIDEIQQVDLVHGINTSARVVCEHCIERRRQERYGEWLNDHDQVPECPIGDHPEIDMYQIKTPAEIVAEGRAMAHCVGDYAGAAKRGQTFIYHVGPDAPYGYTVEIRFNEDGRAWIRQAYGYGNSEVDSSAVEKIIEEYNKNINRR